MNTIEWIILAVATVLLIQLTLYLRKRDRVSLRIAFSYTAIGAVFGAVIASLIFGI